ncbi:nidogen-1-like protein [Lates japonicus]|uniref:Nidogen-1-like protein n=1 Tax=Lates japonicus TaxID=270547 RepID=A0AAD3NE50_LATJO|nr:nidogen-1-like protein [Lates japonicus]
MDLWLLSSLRETPFQLVLPTDLSSSRPSLYPRGGLQFPSTSVDAESKLFEAGFNKGLVKGWFRPQDVINHQR